MRKKLLALLMCATMVLGTGVTAMAKTSDDAEKIYVSKDNANNADLFMQEFYKGDQAIVKTVFNPVEGASVEYGYLESGDTTMTKQVATVVWKKSGKYVPATQVAGDSLNLKAWETKDGVTVTATTDKVVDVVKAITGYTGDIYVKPSAGDVVKITKDSAQAVVANDKYYADAALNNLLYDTATTTSVAQDSDTVAKAAAAAWVTKTTYTGTAPIAVTVYDDNNKVSSVVLTDKTGANIVGVTDGYVDGTKNWVKYVGDGNLVVGSSNIFKSLDDSTVYTQMGFVEKNSEITAALSAALDNKEITKNAVAVSMRNFVVINVPTETLGLGVKANTLEAKACPLYDSTKISSGNYTFDADLLSRTGLSEVNAVSVYKLSAVPAKYDANYGLVRTLKNVATVKVDGTYAFDSSADWADGIFVFDEGTIEEEPTTDANDGVSDASKPATDNTASPKTGDVAPIAALAVVMMGAFGAMVVASKKRA